MALLAGRGGRTMVAVGAAVVVAAGALWLLHGGSPAQPVVKSPVVVPGVVPGGSGTGGGPAMRGLIKLGGWAPGGPADPAAAGGLAYFRWLNARGGVYGRAIAWQVLDSGPGDRLVPSDAHQLIDGDAVFAIFAPAGTAGTTLEAPFAASMGVPVTFAQTSCACLDQPAALPNVFAWGLSDAREGQVLGRYAASHLAGRKIAVLAAPGRDARDAATGLAAAGLRPAASITVAGPAAAPAAVAAARAARATAIIALSPPSTTSAIAQAMTTAGMTGDPLVATSGGAAAGLPDGVITDTFLPTPAAPPGSGAASWIALFRHVRDAYLPRAPLTPQLIDGMAAAYQMTQALFRAGPSLTQQGLITAMTGLSQGPSATPLAYNPVTHSGPEGAYIGITRNGTLIPLTGPQFATTPGQAPPITTSWPPAPATGIPAH